MGLRASRTHMADLQGVLAQCFMSLVFPPMILRSPRSRQRVLMDVYSQRRGLSGTVGARACTEVEGRCGISRRVRSPICLVFLLAKSPTEMTWACPVSTFQTGCQPSELVRRLVTVSTSAPQLLCCGSPFLRCVR